MATIRFYSEERDLFYNLYVTLEQSYTAGTWSDTPFSYDLNMRVSTDYTDDQGDAMRQFTIRDLTDVPPDDTGGPYTNFTDLIQAYTLYYLSASGDFQSSSSSSSSSSGGISSSSSSSSSGGYSSSSSSSSSSS